MNSIKYLVEEARIVKAKVDFKRFRRNEDIMMDVNFEAFVIRALEIQHFGLVKKFASKVTANVIESDRTFRQTEGMSLNQPTFMEQDMYSEDNQQCGMFIFPQ